MRELLTMAGVLLAWFLLQRLAGALFGWPR